MVGNGSVTAPPSAAGNADGQRVVEDVHYVAPPVPTSRGPGHTPRGMSLQCSEPPTRTPSRTSPRYTTPRTRDGEEPRPATTTTAPAPESRCPLASAVPKPSVSLNNRSFPLGNEDDGTERTSIVFHEQPSSHTRHRMLPSTEGRRSMESSEIHFVVESQTSRQQSNGAARGVRGVSAVPTIATETSDIRFTVEPSRGASAVNPKRQSGGMGGVANASSASIQFEVESVNNETHRSTLSRYSIGGTEDEPQPVMPAAQQQQQSLTPACENEHEVTDAPLTPAEDEAPIEFLSESEERRRAKAAEAERRKEVLRQRSLYMSTRPWEANEPNPRARRTSSQSAALRLKRRAAEQEQEIEKRRKAMHARPWRTGSVTPKTSRSVSRSRPQRPSGAHSARSGNTSAREHLVSVGEEASKASQVPPQTPTGAAPPSSSSLERAASSVPTPQARPRALTGSLTTDQAEDTSCTTPAPALQTMQGIVGEEVAEWTNMVNQQRNIQSILTVMRKRELQIANMSRQLETQGRAMRGLNRELYRVRDAYVRRFDCDVMGVALHARLSYPSFHSPVRTAAKLPLSIQRLYPEPKYPAKDYYAMKAAQEGGKLRSVLSDDDLSGSEKEMYAPELLSWKAERAALREEKNRIVSQSRDLLFHVRRGSNIKDIRAVQPTSARGPLERTASGMPTAVDVDGYDRLVDLRLEAQRASVAAATAKKAYAAVQYLSEARKEKNDPPSTALLNVKDARREAKEQYVAGMQRLQQAAQGARSMLERAAARLARHDKKSAASLGNEEEDSSGLEDKRNALHAAQMQLKRVEALLEEAPASEDRMLRSSSTPRHGTSRAGTPRGSISGPTRRGTVSFTRAGSVSTGDVFQRLTSKNVPGTRSSILVPAETAS